LKVFAILYFDLREITFIEKSQLEKSAKSSTLSNTSRI